MDTNNIYIRYNSCCRITGIEKTCDAITKEYNPLIKIAKDCGSAATFVIFIVALILNIIIFYPKIVALFIPTLY